MDENDEKSVSERSHGLDVSVLERFRSAGRAAYDEGFGADSLESNPYWVEYPRPSKIGDIDEIAARWFVDGYVSKLRRYS